MTHIHLDPKTICTYPHADVAGASRASMFTSKKQACNTPPMQSSLVRGAFREYETEEETISKRKKDKNKQQKKQHILHS